MSKFPTVQTLYRLMEIKKKRYSPKQNAKYSLEKEVRAWLDENGPNLFGTGMPIPKLVRTDVASSNRSSTVNTPYNLLIKSKRLLYRWLTDLASKNPKDF